MTIKYCTTKSARVVKVIETLSIRGTGTGDDPVRNVVQYWDFDGNLLAEHDPNDEFTSSTTEGEQPQLSPEEWK